MIVRTKDAFRAIALCTMKKDQTSENQNPVQQFDLYSNQVMMTGEPEQHSNLKNECSMQQDAT